MRSLIPSRSSATPSLGWRGRRSTTVLARLILASAILLPSAAWSALMTIELDDPAKVGDGLCSLREAVENAEADSAIHSACPAGTGADIIDLDGRVITFTDNAPSAYDSPGHNTLEPLDDPAGLTIRNGTLKRSFNNCNGNSGDRTEYRFLRVRTGAQLSVLNVVFENGCASDVDKAAGVVDDDRGGAIYGREAAAITIRFSTFIENDAFEGAAVFGLNSGDVTIVGSEMRDNIANQGVVEFENNANHIPADTIVVANNAIYDNDAGEAIRMRNTDEAWIVNNTLVSNEGEGVRLLEDLNSVVLAHNTIAGNADAGLWINSNVTGAIEIHGNVIGGNDVNGGLSDCVVNVVAGEARRNAFGINGNANGCSGFSFEANNIVPAGPLESILETTAGDPIPSAHGGLTPTVRVPSNSPTVDASNVLLLPDETAMGVDLELDGVDDPIDVDQRGAIRVINTFPDMGATENLFSQMYAPPVPAMAPGALALVGLLLGLLGIRTLRPR